MCCLRLHGGSRGVVEGTARLIVLLTWCAVSLVHELFYGCGANGGRRCPGGGKC